MNKSEEMRRWVAQNTPSHEIRKLLEKDPYQPDNWYRLSMALAKEEGLDAAIDACSQGLYYNPFSALLFFGRGRRNIGLEKYWRCISDCTVAIRLDPNVWNYWYYRGAAWYFQRNYSKAEKDFLQCYNMTPEMDHYVFVDWMFLCGLEMGDRERARDALDMIDTSVEAPTMDYSYRRRVQLYKGEVSPDEFIDRKHIEANCLKVPNRPELEITALTFGLYAYYEFTGDTEKANAVLRELAKRPPSSAFAYLRGMEIVKERGLI